MKSFEIILNDGHHKVNAITHHYQYFKNISQSDLKLLTLLSGCFFFHFIRFLTYQQIVCKLKNLFKGDGFVKIKICFLQVFKCNFLELNYCLFEKHVFINRLIRFTLH